MRALTSLKTYLLHSVLCVTLSLSVCVRYKSLNEYPNGIGDFCLLKTVVMSSHCRCIEKQAVELITRREWFTTSTKQRSFTKTKVSLKIEPTISKGRKLGISLFLSHAQHSSYIHSFQISNSPKIELYEWLQHLIIHLMRNILLFVELIQLCSIWIHWLKNESWSSIASAPKDSELNGLKLCHVIDMKI